MNSSIENQGITTCLKTAFAHSIQGESKDRLQYLFTRLDTIAMDVSRYWTSDFLENLIENAGAGVHIGPQFMIKFSRLFYSQLQIMYFQREVDAVAAGATISEHFNLRKVIEMVAGIIMNSDILGRHLGKGSEVPLMADTNVIEYYESVCSVYSLDEAIAFLEENNWLIPMYLFFVTEAYASLREALDIESVLKG